VDLIRAAAETEARNKLGYTPVLTAAECGNADVLEALLDKGADVDAALPDGRTALHIAAGAGRTAVIALLWRFHCKRDGVDREGRTPLDVARQEHRLGAEKILLASLGEFDEFVEVDGSQGVVRAGEAPIYGDDGDGLLYGRRHGSMQGELGSPLVSDALR
jgi:hypothetical protein